MTPPGTLSVEDAANLLLAGPWTRTAMVARISNAERRVSPSLWARTLGDAVWALHPEPPGDGYVLAAELAGLLAWRYRGCALPDAAAVQALLDLDAGELAWFEDRAHFARRETRQPLRHYRYEVRPRRGGIRLIEAPKPRLREAQRRILRHVLDPIPLHPAAHGGVRGRSVRTAAAVHAGADMVIRLDLATFFPSISAGRVRASLSGFGVPGPVAALVAGLCTSVVPVDVWTAAPRPGAPYLEAHWALGRMLGFPHLPQGAPTSPALANLVAYSLDRRVSGLARSMGAHYSRYVDDLFLSGGPLVRDRVGALVGGARAIVRDEGWALNEAKTRVDGRGGRHSVLGAVVNDTRLCPGARSTGCGPSCTTARPAAGDPKCATDPSTCSPRTCSGGSAGWPRLTRAGGPSCAPPTTASTGRSSPPVDGTDIVDPRERNRGCQGPVSGVRHPDPVRRPRPGDRPR
jgi:RNA-directed DNA polymerase